ncbi:MAG: efflux RND transporter periplasmic adaptor subunit [Luteitalea sp.]|nr:efflux RND transporter periplasmic adaptor subunit [Luteitalea sp.]
MRAKKAGIRHRTVMRKFLIAFALFVAVAAGVFFYSRSGAPASERQPTGGRGGRMGGERPTPTVELGAVTRGEISANLTVVGNLVGAQTVDVGPKVSGRLEAVDVRIGDSVRRGQRLALVEDRELQEQVRQQESAYEVAQATIRQREADLGVAESNARRSRSLFERKILAQQALEDAEAAAQSARAQLDLARAQYSQAGSRLEELRITLANTRVVSPVHGFVGKRYLDPGVQVSPAGPIVSVVDISLVRLVVNLVERDLRRVQPGVPAVVQVDAYPGEAFKGRVARLAPVLDPATRTAQMEVEVPNSDSRLKPGMYARVSLQTAHSQDALVVPRNAVVDQEGRRGVFLVNERTARFTEIRTGIEEPQRVEVVSGLSEGQQVVTTGAAGLRHGDAVQVADQRSGNGTSRAENRPTARKPRSED